MPPLPSNRTQMLPHPVVAKRHTDEAISVSRLANNEECTGLREVGVYRWAFDYEHD